MYVLWHGSKYALYKYTHSLTHSLTCYQLGEWRWIYNILCLCFSTKCHLLMTDLVVAFVLFIFYACVAAVSLIVWPIGKLSSINAPNFISQEKIMHKFEQLTAKDLCHETTPFSESPWSTKINNTQRGSNVSYSCICYSRCFLFSFLRKYSTSKCER